MELHERRQLVAIIIAGLIASRTGETYLSLILENRDDKFNPIRIANNVVDAILQWPERAVK